MSIIKKNLVVKTFKFIIASLFVFFLWGLISLYSFTPILNFFISKEEGYIPDLKGKTKSEAIEILDKAGFKYNIKLIDYKIGCEPGTVFSTYPRSPWKINKNRVVDLNIYDERDQVIILDYKNLTLEEAKKRAKKNRLDIDKINQQPSYEEQFFDRVAAQVPSKGKKVNEGSSLDLWFYRQANDFYKVPHFYGKDFDVVKRSLKEKYFLIADGKGDITYIKNNSLLKNSVIKLEIINALGVREEIFEEDEFRGQPVTIYITVTK